jgi:hypothetical protein
MFRLAQYRLKRAQHGIRNDLDNQQNVIDYMSRLDTSQH